MAAPGSTKDPALVLSSSAFREIVEQALFGTLLVENENIIYANPVATEIFGRPVEQLIGLRLDQVVHPNDRRAGLERARQRAAGATLTAAYSIRGMRPDGSIRELETQSNMIPIDGRRVMMISVFDVTEQRRKLRIVNQMAEAIGSKIGEEFFSSLVLNLASNLQTDFAFVSEIAADRENMRMIAYAADGALATPVTYRLSGTPSEAVINTKRMCWYPSGVADRFPADEFFAQTKIQGYAGVPLKDSKGQVIGVLGIMSQGIIAHEYANEAVLDVYGARASSELERKQSEQALIATGLYLDNLIETANAMVLEMDTNGIVKRINRMVEETTGYHRDDLLGKNWFELMMPERRRKHAATYLADLRNGKLLKVNESPIVTRDGTERMMAWRNSEIRDRDGRITGSLSFGADVTERAKLQKILALVAEEWRGTFDAVNTPILITHRDGKVIRVNRATLELTGLDEFQIVGRKVSELSEHEPWQTAAQMIQFIADESAGTASETRDEHGRTWDITISHFPGSIDQAEKYILVLWNITGIVELQESLRRSETMSAMGTLVAGVAHEVRNPLFGISATLDAFADELNQPNLLDCSSALRTEVTRLQKVMQELLEFGKPSTLDIQRGRLATIVDDAIAYRMLPGVSVATDIPEDLPDLFADRDRLQQVIENLIDNASRFSPRGSPVHVSASVVQQSGRRWIECRVDDNGPGFPADELDRVFEPFFSRREGGTGLGLSIVQRIVQDHSGRVFAENRPEGGARVRILLPIAERPMPPA